MSSGHLQSGERPDRDVRAGMNHQGWLCGKCFPWSPWGGEERREPEGQVVERVFLSSLSFTRIKERGLQPIADVN